MGIDAAGHEETARGVEDLRARGPEGRGPRRDLFPADAEIGPPRPALAEDRPAGYDAIEDRLQERFSLRAFKTFSGVNGASVNRTPTAS